MLECSMRPGFGRAVLTPGILLRRADWVFRGIGAERECLALADSLALRRFVGSRWTSNTDHSRFRDARRLIDLDTHREVFPAVLGGLAARGLLTGQRIAIRCDDLGTNAADAFRLCGGTGRELEDFCGVWREGVGWPTPTRKT